MAHRIGFKKEFLKKRAQTYSKGMRQKLGLMTTFMTDCSTIILDEPMSGLDPLARVEVKNIMIQSRARGKTIFLSSHILSDMEELCDSVAVLDGGRIVFAGTPSSLLQSTGQSHLERAFLALMDKAGLAA
jgi:ABC-2 type transport system ATP-binding protein